MTEVVGWLDLIGVAVFVISGALAAAEKRLDILGFILFGTITGIGRVLKERKPGVRMIAIEPEDSPVLSGGNPGSHKIQGIGAGILPGNLDLDIVDEVQRVSSEEAMEWAHKLMQKEGILAGSYEPVIEGFTDDGNHWGKTLRLGPDGLLYLSQGSSCNICVEEDERRATMMRFALDGSGGEVMATGLRNSVGFDWAPWSGELYATDNGRDLLGDDFPPCELNLIEGGRFYGWPYFNGANIPDPAMGAAPLADMREPTAPVHGFRAHNAPLGMTFIDATNWPEGYERSALVALHGSWNRSTPDGYKVVSLHWTEDGVEERDFLSGFNKDGSITGRPVDVAQGPDGAIYISDDYASAIYRVSYGDGEQSWSPQPVEVPAASKLDKEAPAWLDGADLQAMAERGEQLYFYYDCASCHEAGENPKLLTNLADRLGYNAVIEALKSPQSPMPIFPLNEVELREMAVYLLQPAGTQETP